MIFSNIPWSRGTTLIEASAGTGKTYNIQHLYLRFVVEKGFKPAEILVVTFSEAATNELKERICGNLRKADKLLSFRAVNKSFSNLPEGEDMSLLAILQKGVDNFGLAEIRRRVGFALCAFDEAAVSTIHSFCLKVLQDHAFESGMPYGVEVTESKRGLYKEFAYDFLRKHGMNNKSFESRLFRKNFTEEWFVSIAENVYGKDDIKYLDIQEFPDIKNMYATLVSEYDLQWQKYAKRNKKLGELFAVIEQKSVANEAVCEHVYELIAELNIAKNKYFQEKFSEEFQKSFLGIKGYAEQVVRKYSILFFKFLKNKYKDSVVTKNNRVLSFDDFLYMTEQAIHKKNSRLVQVVRREYSAVLVDEFQDTSSVQFDIFYSFFGGGVLPFFMIGDPKQSIYGFRGADIFSYLKAVNASGVMQRTLKRNFRSTPELLKNFNLLFSGAPSMPFIYKQIEYTEVIAGRNDSEKMVFSQERTPLEIWWNEFSGNSVGAGEAQELAISAVVSDIIAKLEQSDVGSAYVSGESGREHLVPEDFAVLVNNNSQAVAVRDELVRRGVPAVVLKSGNVFSSTEARQLFDILAGVVNPGNERLVKAALSCDCFAYTLAELHGLNTVEQRVWEYWLDFFHVLKELWLSAGILVMLKRLFYSEHDAIGRRSCNINLVRGGRAQRVLTNYYHLFEIFAQKENELAFTPEQLLSEFERFVLNPEEESEYEMRLENDSKAVKVITVHKSKGLQFNIVYVPFFFMHDVSKNIFPKTRPLVGNFQEEEKRVIFFSAVEISHYQEELQKKNQAELLRLFYVALTRAINKCIVLGGNIKGMKNCGLGVLLGNDFERVAGWREDGLISIADDWVCTSGVYYGSSEEVELSFTAFTGSISREWGVMSYSSLVRHDFEADDVRKDRIDVRIAELFGRDSVLHEGSGLELSGSIIDNLAVFPSSSKTGSAIHEILEEADFSRGSNSLEDELILNRLHKYGLLDNGYSGHEYTVEIKAVRSLIEIVSAVKLENTFVDKFSLNSVSPEQVVSEMSFYFPVNKKILLDRFAGFLQKKGLQEYRDNAELAEVIASLGISFQRKGFREGYMYGLIDLVFEYEGRFYFADWKTNNLQSYGGYSGKAVLASMNDSGYLLQFYLYTVALVLFLQRRIEKFSYTRHFGGGYYFYLRGLELDKNSQGVFYEYPSEKEIHELIDIFTGENHEDS